MFCPVCNHHDTKVIDSRAASGGFTIRRRRECPKCSFRFSTYEQQELLDQTIIKQDGRREAYAREKLEKGLKRALEKRPYTRESFQTLVAQIERAIQKLKKQELTSRDLGEIVIKFLKKFDKIAYIRFASVYRAFEDMKTFEKEVASLVKTKAKKLKKH
jgi:transcriptional repressor NrdR